MKNLNLTKGDLLKICSSLGCVGVSANDGKSDIVKVLNDKFGYEKFRFPKSGSGQTYEIKNDNKNFGDYAKLKRDLKPQESGVFIVCPCCNRELDRKNFKNLSHKYVKFCKDCRELKHGQ